MKSVLIFFCAVILTACEGYMNQSTTSFERRPYNEISKVLQIKNFNAVSITGASSAEITNGVFEVIVKGDSIDLQDLQVSVLNGKLTYDILQKPIQRFGIKWNIKVPAIAAVEVSGASKVIIHQFNNQQLIANISGASTLDAFGMSTQSAEIDVSGASVAKVNVQKTLAAKVSGASQLIYRGNPTLKTNISGASTIKQD